MTSGYQSPVQFDSVRALVRYVDEEQAVIEIHAILQRPLPMPGGPQLGYGKSLEVLIELHSSDGFYDEQCLPLPVRHRQGKVRFEVVRPQRWWPAGMGEQPLYDLTVSLLLADHVTDQWSTTMGFTSVRARPVNSPRRPSPTAPHLSMLVNGQAWDIGAVVAIDQIHEHSLLPVTGNSLLLVRDHYGPDVLYEAADRAGIMLIQCVPIHPEGRPEFDVPTQVCRLAAHPSLAGWFVGHLGQVSQRIARRLQRLDPTHILIIDAAEHWAA